MGQVELHVVSTAAFLKALSAAAHSNIQTGIATLLAQRPHCFIPIREIEAWLWGDDINCRPVLPKVNIEVAVFKLRKKGMHIVNRWGDAYSYEPRI